MVKSAGKFNQPYKKTGSSGETVLQAEADLLWFK